MDIKDKNSLKPALFTARPELWFSMGIFIMSAVFFWQAQITKIDEVGVNARTLPSIMSAAIALYSLLSIVQLIRQVPRVEMPSSRGRAVFWPVVVPLMVEMVLYVQLIHLVGYFLSTFLIMIAVFWAFGLRTIKQNLLLSILAALVGEVLFIRLLGMYMPDGYLITLIGF